MKDDLAAAMRRATELTRAQDVIAATRVIQDALGGSASTGSVQTAQASPPRLAFEAGDRRNTGAASKPAAAQPAKPQRLCKPLSEVLRTLKEGRAKLLDLPGRAPAAQPPISDGAQFLPRSFTCDAGTREYKVYIPAPAAARPRGMILMLHGCTQTPDDFAVGTAMNRLADKHNLVVAYPWQPKSKNPAACWNWFTPAHQLRDRGEPAILAGITRHLMQEFGFDRRQVFVAGLSAGGAMAAVLAEVYPDLYAAAGVHSGLAYRSANDVMSAFSAMKGETNLAPNPGPKATNPPVRMIVFHGSADSTVHPSNAKRLVDGVTLKLSTEERSSKNGRSYTRSVFTDAAGAAAMECWLIEGAGHAWSGGNTGGSFTDHQGPDASGEIVRFFLAQQRAA